MTLYDKRKNKLIEELKDKEYRDAFVEEHIDTGIPFQIKALREQRDLTQKGFEKLSGMKQALISRLENPNYSSFTLSTLKKIASIFDIGLIVRFVPISDLIKWELNLSSDSLEAVSFDEDPYFKEQPEEELIKELAQFKDTINQGLVNNDVINLAEHRRQMQQSILEKQLNEQQEPKKREVIGV